MWLMRKSANSTALLERARELGVRPSNYSIPAAQAEVQISDELRKAASEIVDMLEDDNPVGESAAEGKSQPESSSGTTLEFAAVANGSDRRLGRSEANPKIIHLHI